MNKKETARGVGISPTLICGAQRYSSSSFRYPKAIWGSDIIHMIDVGGQFLFCIIINFRVI